MARAYQKRAGEHQGQEAQGVQEALEVYAREGAPRLPGLREDRGAVGRAGDGLPDAVNLDQAR